MDFELNVTRLIIFFKTFITIFIQIHALEKLELMGVWQLAVAFLVGLFDQLKMLVVFVGF